MNLNNLHCSCINPTIPNSQCPVHGTSVQDLFGLRAAPRVGRVIEVEPVTLRPSKTLIGAVDAVPTGRCICHLFDTPGYVAHCPEHGDAPHLEHEPAPEPVALSPLPLLLAAATLIPDQPTTEQWHTIKEAIRALAPSPFRS